MPSDKSTVATKADFVPKVVGKTDRDRSFSGVLAHDERSQQPRPEVHPEALNVLYTDTFSYRVGWASLPTLIII